MVEQTSTPSGDQSWQDHRQSLKERRRRFRRPYQVFSQAKQVVGPRRDLPAALVRKTRALWRSTAAQLAALGPRQRSVVLAITALVLAATAVVSLSVLLSLSPQDVRRSAYPAGGPPTGTQGQGRQTPPSPGPAGQPSQQLRVTGVNQNGQRIALTCPASQFIDTFSRTGSDEGVPCFRVQVDGQLDVGAIRRTCENSWVNISSITPQDCRNNLVVRDGATGFAIASDVQFPSDTRLNSLPTFPKLEEAKAVNDVAGQAQSLVNQVETLSSCNDQNCLSQLRQARQQVGSLAASVDCDPNDFVCQNQRQIADRAGQATNQVLENVTVRVETNQAQETLGSLQAQILNIERSNCSDSICVRRLAELRGRLALLAQDPGQAEACSLPASCQVARSQASQVNATVNQTISRLNSLRSQARQLAQAKVRTEQALVKDPDNTRAAEQLSQIDQQLFELQNQVSGNDRQAVRNYIANQNETVRRSTNQFRQDQTNALLSSLEQALDDRLALNQLRLSEPKNTQVLDEIRAVDLEIQALTRQARQTSQNDGQVNTRITALTQQNAAAIADLANQAAETDDGGQADQPSAGQPDQPPGPVADVRPDPQQQLAERTTRLALNNQINTLNRQLGQLNPAQPDNSDIAQAEGIARKAQNIITSQTDESVLRRARQTLAQARQYLTAQTDLPAPTGPLTGPPGQDRGTAPAGERPRPQPLAGGITAVLRNVGSILSNLVGQVTRQGSSSQPAPEQTPVQIPDRSDKPVTPGQPDDTEPTPPSRDQLVTAACSQGFGFSGQVLNCVSRALELDGCRALDASLALQCSQDVIERYDRQAEQLIATLAQLQLQSAEGQPVDSSVTDSAAADDQPAAGPAFADQLNRLAQLGQQIVETRQQLTQANDLSTIDMLAARLADAQSRYADQLAAARSQAPARTELQIIDTIDQNTSSTLALLTSPPAPDQDVTSSTPPGGPSTASQGGPEERPTAGGITSVISNVGSFLRNLARLNQRQGSSSQAPSTTPSTGQSEAERIVLTSQLDRLRELERQLDRLDPGDSLYQLELAQLQNNAAMIMADLKPSQTGPDDLAEALDTGQRILDSTTAQLAQTDGQPLSAPGADQSGPQPDEAPATTQPLPAEEPPDSNIFARALSLVRSFRALNLVRDFLSPERTGGRVSTLPDEGDDTQLRLSQAAGRLETLRQEVLELNNDDQADRQRAEQLAIEAHSIYTQLGDRDAPLDQRIDVYKAFLEAAALLRSDQPSEIYPTACQTSQLGVEYFTSQQLCTLAGGEVLDPTQFAEFQANLAQTSSQVQSQLEMLSLLDQQLASLNPQDAADILTAQRIRQDARSIIQNLVQLDENHPQIVDAIAQASSLVRDANRFITATRSLPLNQIPEPTAIVPADQAVPLPAIIGGFEPGIRETKCLKSGQSIFTSSPEVCQQVGGSTDQALLATVLQTVTGTRNQSSFTNSPTPANQTSCYFIGRLIPAFTSKPEICTNFQGSLTPPGADQSTSSPPDTSTVQQTADSQALTAPLGEYHPSGRGVAGRKIKCQQGPWTYFAVSADVCTNGGGQVAELSLLERAGAAIGRTPRISIDQQLADTCQRSTGGGSTRFENCLSYQLELQSCRTGLASDVRIRSCLDSVQARYGLANRPEPISTDQPDEETAEFKLFGDDTSAGTTEEFELSGVVTLDSLVTRATRLDDVLADLDGNNPDDLATAERYRTELSSIVSILQANELSLEEMTLVYNALDSSNQLLTSSEQSQNHPVACRFQNQVNRSVLYTSSEQVCLGIRGFPEEVAQLPLTVGEYERGIREVRCSVGSLLIFADTQETCGDLFQVDDAQLGGTPEPLGLVEDVGRRLGIEPRSNFDDRVAQRCQDQGSLLSAGFENCVRRQLAVQACVINLDAFDTTNETCQRLVDAQLNLTEREVEQEADSESLSPTDDHRQPNPQLATQFPPHVFSHLESTASLSECRGACGLHFPNQTSPNYSSCTAHCSEANQLGLLGSEADQIEPPLQSQLNINERVDSQLAQAADSCLTIGAGGLGGVANCYTSLARGIERQACELRLGPEATPQEIRGCLVEVDQKYGVQNQDQVPQDTASQKEAGRLQLEIQNIQSLINQIFRFPSGSTANQAQSSTTTQQTPLVACPTTDSVNSCTCSFNDSPDKTFQVDPGQLCKDGKLVNVNLQSSTSADQSLAPTQATSIPGKVVNDLVATGSELACQSRCTFHFFSENSLQVCAEICHEIGINDAFTPGTTSNQPEPISLTLNTLDDRRVTLALDFANNDFRCNRNDPDGLIVFEISTSEEVELCLGDLPNSTLESKPRAQSDSDWTAVASSQAAATPQEEFVTQSTYRCEYPSGSVRELGSIPQQRVSPEADLCSRDGGQFQQVFPDGSVVIVDGSTSTSTPTQAQPQTVEPDYVCVDGTPHELTASTTVYPVNEPSECRSDQSVIAYTDDDQLLLFRPAQDDHQSSQPAYRCTITDGNGTRSQVISGTPDPIGECAAAGGTAAPIAPSTPAQPTTTGQPSFGSDTVYQRISLGQACDSTTSTSQLDCLCQGQVIAFNSSGVCSTSSSQPTSGNLTCPDNSICSCVEDGFSLYTVTAGEDITCPTGTIITQGVTSITQGLTCTTQACQCLVDGALAITSRGNSILGCDPGTFIELEFQTRPPQAPTSPAASVPPSQPSSQPAGQSGRCSVFLSGSCNEDETPIADSSCSNNVRCLPNPNLVNQKTAPVSGASKDQAPANFIQNLFTTPIKFITDRLSSTTTSTSTKSKPQADLPPADPTNKKSPAPKGTEDSAAQASPQEPTPLSILQRALSTPFGTIVRSLQNLLPAGLKPTSLSKPSTQEQPISVSLPRADDATSSTLEQLQNTSHFSDNPNFSRDIRSGFIGPCNRHNDQTTDTICYIPSERGFLKTCVNYPLPDSSLTETAICHQYGVTQDFFATMAPSLSDDYRNSEDILSALFDLSADLAPFGDQTRSQQCYVPGQPDPVYINPNRLTCEDLFEYQTIPPAINIEDHYSPLNQNAAHIFYRGVCLSSQGSSSTQGVVINPSSPEDCSTYMNRGFTRPISGLPTNQPITIEIRLQPSEYNSVLLSALPPSIVQTPGHNQRLINLAQVGPYLDTPTEGRTNCSFTALDKNQSNTRFKFLFSVDSRQTSLCQEDNFSIITPPAQAQSSSPSPAVTPTAQPSLFTACVRSVDGVSENVHQGAADCLSDLTPVSFTAPSQGPTEPLTTCPNEATTCFCRSGPDGQDLHLIYPEQSCDPGTAIYPDSNAALIFSTPTSAGSPSPGNKTAPQPVTKDRPPTNFIQNLLNSATNTLKRFLGY